MAQAELASAEAYFYEGQLKLAKQQAKRAKAGLIDGTPNWLRADDILAFEMPNASEPVSPEIEAWIATKPGSTWSWPPPWRR